MVGKIPSKEAEETVEENIPEEDMIKETKET